MGRSTEPRRGTGRGRQLASSALCLLQKETLRAGATDGLPGRLYHRKEDSLKPCSSLELLESPSEQRDHPSH